MVADQALTTVLTDQGAMVHTYNYGTYILTDIVSVGVAAFPDAEPGASGESRIITTIQNAGDGDDLQTQHDQVLEEIQSGARSLSL